LNIKNYNFEELTAFLKELKIPAYRAKQIFSWLYQKNVRNWDEMSDLPKTIRQSFQIQGIALGCLSLAEKVADTDGTVKFLFELADGNKVESVFLPEPERATVCFSTQVGCGMGCAFCATGRNGYTRNLSAGEIIDQPLRIGKITGTGITNLVAMGQGEPLLNYDQLLKAIRIINDPRGVGLGARRITISSCGIIPGMLRLAGEGLQVNLAVSLHAADNELRDRLMPVNRKYPLPRLLEACDHYIEKTGRRITFEYALIDGVNDRPEDLGNLARLLSGRLCHVNLIPFNPVPGSGFDRARPERIREFEIGLNKAHIETTIRRERGTSLTAACGQLRGGRE